MSNAGSPRYESPGYLASYLEAEWSDILWPVTELVEGQNPLLGPVFYQGIGTLVRDCQKYLNRELERYCDVGGATGRTLYEIGKALPTLRELVLVEPSAQFCSWARHFLKGGQEERFDWAPVVDKLRRPDYRPVVARPTPFQESDAKRIFVYEMTVEEVPRPAGYFDLVTCLNVLDRLDNPSMFVQKLGRLVEPEGILILASPLDFEEKFTPDQDRWVRDLRDLFAGSPWEILEDRDLLYPFRAYHRKQLIYSSQVLVVRKKGAV